MKKKYFFVLLFFLLIKSTVGQINLSVYSEVSVITAGPGTELYEAFGHSAIRIKDPVLRLDLIYNYGMFDFEAPNFYGNFTKGKLLYKLARYDFKYFIASYKRDKRWVKQQVLNLNLQQKQSFFKYLEQNAQPQNATYFYDPYFNNCATKLRDITKTILGDNVTFKSSNIEKNLSLRQLMDKEIPWNTWGSFGINLALGNTLDKNTSNIGYMYLPDYVYSIFKESEIFIDNQPKSLVKREDTLLDFKEIEQSILILNPLLIFSILSIIGIFITFLDYKKQTRRKGFDFILLFSTGIVGVLIIFLWFFTNHSTTPNNFNILWAFAPNLLVAFIMLRNQHQKWLGSYFYITLSLLILVSILWLIGIQSFPISVIPFLLLLFIRYFFLLNRIKNQQ